MIHDKNKYFATLPEDELGDVLHSKVMDYFDEIRDLGLIELWIRSYDAFNRGLRHGGKLRDTGEQGEYKQVFVNHYRSLLQHKMSLTIKQRPSFEPRAANTDYKSQGQVILARGLLDYYMREKKLEKTLKKAIGFALRYGEGCVRAEWDTGIGEVYAVDPDTNKPVNEGDICYESFSPIDVIRDTSCESFEQNDWIIIRTYRNRYDLIAKYADFESIEEEEVRKEIEKLRDQIIAVPSKEQVSRDGNLIGYHNRETDLVPVYEFYHKKTPAVPEGKFTTFLDSDTVLIDGPLPYDEIPVYSVMGSDIDGSNFGYSVAFDLLPLQEAVDNLHSAVLTNQKTFTVQMVALPKGSGISEATLGEGLSVIFYEPRDVPGGGKPEAINLTATPQEVFNYIEKLENLMEILSGINSVTRGNPESNINSGVAMALIQSMAIEYSANLQQNYVSLLESVGTQTINVLKKYANTERVAQITGKTNKSYLKTFTGEDIADINRVTVDVGSPLARTTAGKLQILENLIQMGFIKTPEQYIQVMNTGTLEPAIESATSELMLIKDENEKLSEGDESIMSVATDDHALHIKEHRTVLASQESRNDQAIVMATLNHIQMHIDLLSTTDPRMLQMMGQQALAPQAPQQMGAPEPGQEGMPALENPELSGVEGVGDVERLPMNPL